MTVDGHAVHEHRVLFLAPTRKDATLTQSVLERAGIACACYSGFAELCSDLADGAGAILLSEEAITGVTGSCLTRWLDQQPSWSDLPLLVLARPGADSAAVAQAMDLLGNVTVLERPARISALVSAVRSAIRARGRQYQIRDQLEESERAAARLRQSVDEMQTLLETIPIGVYIAHDANAEYITGNRSAGTILPTDPELGALRRAAHGEEVRGEEVQRVADDDTARHSVVWARPLYEPGGAPRGAVAAAVDITEQKRAQEALRDADRRKDDFLAILAHELRNPLAPIRNGLHILRITSERDATAERVGDMLERQVSHMVRLVDDLLEVSRITRGKIDLRRESVAVSGVVQNAVEISRPLIDAAGHELIVTIATEPLVLEADPARIAQVIANLLNNAAKYTEDAGRIALTVKREGAAVVISVRDTGVGIPAEMLPRVFDLFTQIHRNADRSQGGLGIGLTLVKTLVEMHGGTVVARSEGAGRGSEFIVKLPLSKVTQAGVERNAGDSPSRQLNARRILVVDDNRDAAESLGMLIKLLGADVHVAFDGPEALNALVEYRPTVVLLDIGMHDMDGYEVARRIRQQPELKDTTLIALTGWGQEEDRRRTRAAGFDYHLIKPADIGALQTLLASLE